MKIQIDNLPAENGRLNDNQTRDTENPFVPRANQDHEKKGRFLTGFKLAIVVSIFLSLGCATYYDYKNVKNLNSKKRKKAFRYDSERCQAGAARQARSQDAFILPDSGLDDRPSLFRKCMRRKGWRLRK